MDLKQLEYFSAIVEEGSISAAAKHLHISQPPLSAQLHRLEEELGAPLMERGPRRCTPTEAGRVLYQRAKQLLVLADAARDEVGQLGGGVRGTLRLGLISSCGPTLLTPAFSDFFRRFPQLRLELREGNTYQLVELLRTGAIEAAVLRTPFPQEGLDCRRISQEPLAAVGDPALFEKLPDGPLPLAALSGVPVVFYRRFEGLLKNAFRREGAQLVARCIAEDARTALALAQAGLGLALVPRTAAALGHGTLILQEIDAPELVTQVTVAFREGGPMSEGARAFAAMFADVRGAQQSKKE